MELVGTSESKVSHPPFGVGGSTLGNGDTQGQDMRTLACGIGGRAVCPCSAGGTGDSGFRNSSHLIHHASPLPGNHAGAAETVVERKKAKQAFGGG